MIRVSEYPHLQRASENYQHVEEILNDGYRLLSWFYNIIRLSALHVYHSALTFTPLGTCLHQMYSSRFPNRIVVRQGVPQHWSHLVAILHEHSSSVNVLSFLPDRSRLASGLYDHTVRLWDCASGVPIATLKGHSESVTSLSFSPDRSRLASGLYNHTVRLWDCASGVPIATLKGHSDFVTSLSFSPDRSQLVSGSYKDTVILWDCATGASIATIKGDPQSVHSLSCSHNGPQLPSMLAGTVLNHHDGDINVSFSTLNTKSDFFLSKK